jgi:ArsR family transcriptional regulator, nickel/cobalt-responsive transcriptional repressor
VAHGGPGRLASELDADYAAVVAETMQALATPSRVRILGRLHAGACSVNDLAEAVGMEPSAVSHQLRLLRHLGLVIGRRDGRRIVYDLYDDHVGELLEQAISHVEHVRAGLARTAPAVELTEA